MKTSTRLISIALVAGTALFGATAANAADIPNPPGVLLDTVTATIGATPLTLDLNDSASWVSMDPSANDGLLANKDECMLARDAAERVYAELELTILRAGTYTFRIVDTVPAFDGTISSSPIQDPFLALYEDFDPTDLDAGVVGCNDDQYMILDTPWENGDTFPTTGNSNTNDRWSHFTAELQPGHYSVVLTTWGAVTESDWAALVAADVAPQSAIFEYWGPECGIETAECLADTGVDSQPALMTGLALLVIGMAVIAVRRRRA